MEITDELIKYLSELSVNEVLQFCTEQFPGKVSFSSSLGYEDQVLTHFIFTGNHDIDVFTLDTGRQFPESYSVLRATEERFQKRIRVLFPKHELVQDYVDTHGINAFYESPELRKGCCAVRKIEPLKRALAGKKIWITGLRAQQSENRSDLPMIEYDAGFDIVKVHPLLHWSLDEVKETVKKYNIPYNVLHDRGFVSIGCAPCTRAIREGEDFRAGRWWWESNSKKECGLHEQR